jgi:hypothetical protein
MNSGTFTLILFALLIFYVAIKFFTQSFADFLDKGAKTTLWIWLPFKALQLLLREFREKKLK